MNHAKRRVANDLQQRRSINPQRTGYGEAGLQTSRAQGHEIAIVLGHPGFYTRFGFSAELAQLLKSPFGNGEAWMAMELEAGALEDVEGQVEYSPPFKLLG